MRLAPLLLVIAACSANGDPRQKSPKTVDDSDSDTDTDATYVSEVWEWVVGVAERVDPDGVGERQTHPTVTVAPDGSTLVAWDSGQGPSERAMFRVWSPEGDASEVIQLANAAGMGFTTPDSAPSSDGWWMTVRLGNTIDIGTAERDGGGFQRAASAAASGPGVAFWSTPDIVQIDGGAVVAWWEGGRDLDDPAVYWMRSYGDDLEPLTDASIIDSGPGGSPMDLDSTPSGGFRGAWSRDGEIAAQEYDAASDPVGAQIHVAHGDREVPPGRTVIATAEEGHFVVGWHYQLEDQTHLGNQLAFFASEGQAVGDPVDVGPSGSGRLELAVAADVVVVAWDEPGDDGDVGLQPFGLSAGIPLAEPIIVHDQTAGLQERCSLSARTLASGDIEVRIAWEDIPTPGAEATLWTRTLTWTKTSQ